MLNSVVLVGRLTKEPEVYEGKEGLKMVTFSLAFSEGKDETGFIDCKCFNSTAEVAEKWLSKGDKVAVDGRISQRKFQRKDGSNGSVVEIIVSNLEYIDVLKTNNVEEPNVEDIAPEPVAEEKPVAKTTRRSR